MVVHPVIQGKTILKIIYHMGRQKQEINLTDHTFHFSNFCALLLVLEGTVLFDIQLYFAATMW